jgi:dephospho-CoA kinase
MMRMRVMALTGGIASGKSTVCRLLREWLPTVVIFDCDEAVYRISRNSTASGEILPEMRLGSRRGGAHGGRILRVFPQSLP